MDRVRLVRLAHMVYAHRDLETITKFLKDFGFELEHETNDAIYLRGYGEQPYLYVVRKTEGEPAFLGGCWLVESHADLERAAQIPGATPITPVDAPGGGEEVVVHECAARSRAALMHSPNGFPLRLIHSQQMRTPEPHASAQLVNHEGSKPRAGEFVRFPGPRPAKIHKLGHYGFGCRDFDETLRWHTVRRAGDALADTARPTLTSTRPTSCRRTTRRTSARSCD